MHGAMPSPSWPRRVTSVTAPQRRHECRVPPGGREPHNNIFSRAFVLLFTCVEDYYFEVSYTVVVHRVEHTTADRCTVGASFTFYLTSGKFCWLAGCKPAMFFLCFFEMMVGCFLFCFCFAFSFVFFCPFVFVISHLCVCFQRVVFVPPCFFLSFLPSVLPSFPPPTPRTHCSPFLAWTRFWYYHGWFGLLLIHFSHFLFGVSRLSVFEVFTCHPT